MLGERAWIFIGQHDNVVFTRQCVDDVEVAIGKGLPRVLLRIGVNEVFSAFASLDFENRR